MDIGKSFSYQWNDPRWMNKLGLGALILMVPILNFTWIGYMVAIMRNVMDKSPEPLPEWENFEKKFIDGLILFAARLLYALPMLVVLCLPLTILLFSGVLSGNERLQNISQVLAGTGSILFFSFLCLILLYSLLLSFIYPAIEIIFAREDTFASCFKFREAFALVNKNLSAFFTAWIVNVGGGLVVGLVIGTMTGLVGWIPCVGWIASVVLSMGSGIYISTIYSHLFGQFGALTAQ